jgi:hypothetical protein
LAFLSPSQSSFWIWGKAELNQVLLESAGTINGTECGTNDQFGNEKDRFGVFVKNVRAGKNFESD